MKNKSYTEKCRAKNKRDNVILSWSSGKDSALALSQILGNTNLNLVALMTTYVQDRVPFQETPIEVVRAQAEQLDLPLIEIELPEIFPKNSIYQSLIVEHIAQYSTQIDVVAFGDIYCNGIAEYRRSYLEPVGYQCFFPLLGQSPQDLARLVINHGIEAKIITVDTEQLSGEFVGRDYTLSLVNSLPDGVDPCGENGEFHTLVVNMPQFKRPLLIDYQDIDRRGRFHYQTYRLA